MDIARAVEDRLHASSNLVLRLGLGAVFIAHGCQQVFGAFGGKGLSGAIAVAALAGFQPAPLWGAVLALTELLGGLAVLLGFRVRAAAGLLAFAMAVAIVKVHLPLGFFGPRGVEYPLALFCAALALVLAGSGPYSLDTALRLTHERRIAKKALAEAAAEHAPPAEEE